MTDQSHSEELIYSKADAEVLCTKVSPGCDHCYAEARMDTRLHKVKWGAGQPRQRTKTWGDPVKWNKAHEAFFAEHGRRQRVFCASLADVFDNEVDPEWRADLFALVQKTPNLDWLLLTKRIGNAAQMIDDAASELEQWPVEWVATGKLVIPNVWLGATIVNQEEADRDIPKLLATPARVRFLSCEPLLGPVNVSRFFAPDGQLPGCEWRGIDWVIVGGESGHGARPMHPEWARSIVAQCLAAGVPVLMKQWGEFIPWERDSKVVPRVWRSQHGLAKWSPPPAARGLLIHDDLAVERVGKKAAGRLLDGVEHNGFPA